MYDEVDRKIAKGGYSCSNCKECCNFEISGLSLFVTNIEFEYFRMNTDKIRIPEGNICPYLDKEDGCSVRNIRPLGCRTFFCNPSDEIELSEIYEEALAKIKAFVEKNHLEYSYNLWLNDLKGK